MAEICTDRKRICQVFSWNFGTIMSHFVYVVMLTTCFAGLTVVTNGQCNGEELQRFVNCSSTVGTPSKYVCCDVDGLGKITSVNISKDYTLECFNNASGRTQLHYFGHNGVSVWVTNGCSALFKVCGEAMTTASTETPSAAQTVTSVCLTTVNYSTKTHQNKSTLSGRTTTSSTRLFMAYTESGTTTNLPVTESRTTTNLPVTESRTTTNLPVTELQTAANLPVTELQTAANLPVTESQTTSNLPITESQTTSNLPVTESRTTSPLSITESRTPLYTTVTESMATPAITVTEPSTTPATVVTDSIHIPATVISSLSKTTTEGNRTSLSAFNAQTLSTKRISTTSSGAASISLSSVQAILTPTSTNTKPISTAAKLPSEVTRSYGYADYNITASALASVNDTSRSPIHHDTAVTSPIIPTNHNNTWIGTADISLQHNAANTLSPGVIAGIVAGGLLFILLCVAYVYIVSSDDPCNCQVTPRICV